ncbi:MAG: ISLre2 family transposase [Anaerolineales bacterium]|nr:MAG: ISLre2 family transposase [Anaerolineales bacterium]
MGKSIVLLDGAFELEEVRGWEGKIFQQVCEQGRREAKAYLEELEEALYEQRPAGWEVVGFRERVLVTRIGEVRLRRRLYQEGSGSYHFLLDEYLGLKTHQAATPEMQAMCTKLAGEMSFRKAADILTEWLAGLLCHSTVWRLLQRTGEAAISAETAAVEAVFARGEVGPEAGERRVERLYMEADGVYVRLQRQPNKHLEVHSAIAYEGWERLPAARESYRLCEKRVYCHAGEQFAFWEGVSLAWAHKWDLSSVQEVIHGGDGARWVRAGAQEFPGAIWQLDSYHLARACGRAMGAQVGQALYQALREGKTSQAQQLLHATDAPLREGKPAQQAYRWVNKVAQEGWGVDWRIRQNVTDDAARGLGCMEGNLAHLLAVRMKGKGRSWSPSGARNMAKVRELLANQEVQRWCFRQAHTEIPRKHRIQTRPQGIDPGQYIQASVPALLGPFPNKPWVQRLRQLIHSSHLLN